MLLASLPSQVADLYRYVQANQALASHVPCYCGCGQGTGHRSLADCFINRAGLYDDHASNCDICLGIADQVRQLSAQGLDLPAIRASVDQEWSRYGPPTKTS